MPAEVKRLPHPLDTCYCGDARRDHVDGTGRCLMPDDLTHGFQPCTRFRLVEAYKTNSAGGNDAA